MQPYLAVEKKLNDEFDALLATYWNAENPEHEPLDMDWPMYNTLADDDRCFTFTARDGRDNLVGALMYVVTKHPHHKTMTIAACDIICVNPKFRGQGIGSKLIVYAEPKLIALGAKQIVHMHKHIYDTQPLTVPLGYEPIETALRKKVA